MTRIPVNLELLIWAHDRTGLEWLELGGATAFRINNTRGGTP